MPSMFSVLIYIYYIGLTAVLSYTETPDYCMFLVMSKVTNAPHDQA